jgi:hypothetical protein
MQILREQGPSCTRTTTQLVSRSMCISVNQLKAPAGGVRKRTFTLENSAYKKILSRRLNVVTEVGTQSQRAIVIQLLVTRPPHGVSHTFHFDFRLEPQSLPLGSLR